MLTYVLDQAACIRAIDGPWDEFAAANGAPELTVAHVMGRPVVAFVTGLEMRTLTTLLFERARKSPVRPLPFRCDSPDARRYLTMTLTAEPPDLLVCSTVLERFEPRTHRGLLDRTAPRSPHDTVMLCGWCRKALMDDGRWVEVDEAIEKWGLFTATPLPRLSHGICEACRRWLEADA
jgi:hypothetical protein